MDQPATASGRSRLDLVQTLSREQGFILAYAYAIVRDHHGAEDVYQDVALTLARDWDRVPAGIPRPWLKELVRRKALEAARRLRRHVLLGDAALVGIADAIEQADPAGAGMGALRAALARCLDKLPAETRSVIEGRYRDEATCEAIAARVGRTVSGVYALLKRSRVMLATCIERAVPVQHAEFGDA